MDTDGSLSARELARAVKSLGAYRVKTLEGGFNRWVADGLPVETSTSDYESGALALLQDEIVALIPKLQDPTFVVPLMSAITTGVIAVANYHVTLRLFGVWGLTYSLAAKLSTYSTPQEFADDVTKTVNSIKAVLPGAKKVVKRSIGVPRKGEELARQQRANAVRRGFSEKNGTAEDSSSAVGAAGSSSAEESSVAVAVASEEAPKVASQ